MLPFRVMGRYISLSGREWLKISFCSHVLICFVRYQNNNETIEADLYNGGIFLGCQFGSAAMYIWAVGILASGQSSTMAGTYAGQFAMEGFLNLHWPKWKRLLITRLIAVVPTLTIALVSNVSDLSITNQYLNAVMSLQLPFAAIPTIAFTSDERLMGQFKNGL